jgi:hypothetical protein
MTVNPISFRLPTFDLSNEEGRQAAHRYTASGIVDLNQAIASLKSQITKLSPVSSFTQPSTTGSGGSAPSTPFPFPGLGSVRDETGSASYTPIAADNGILIVFNDASPVAVTLNSAIASPYFLFVTNFGAGLVTFTPSSGTINGAASASINENYFGEVAFDGTNWHLSADLSGVGTAGYIPAWTAPSVLGNSHLDDAVTSPNTLTASSPLNVAGNANGGLFTTFTLTPTELAAAQAALPASLTAASIVGIDKVNAYNSVVALDSAHPWSIAVASFLGAYTDGTMAGSVGLVGAWDYVNNIEFALYVGYNGQIYVEPLANADFPTADGRVGIKNLTPAYQLDVNGDINTSGLYHSFVYSVAGTPLPSAATAGVGARAFVSDATLNTFGSTYAGGGANKVPVYSDGTNWLIG